LAAFAVEQGDITKFAVSLAILALTVFGGRLYAWFSVGRARVAKIDV